MELVVSISAVLTERFKIDIKFVATVVLLFEYAIAFIKFVSVAVVPVEVVYGKSVALPRYNATTSGPFCILLLGIVPIGDGETKIFPKCAIPFASVTNPSKS